MRQTQPDPKIHSQHTSHEPPLPRPSARERHTCHAHLGVERQELVNASDLQLADAVSSPSEPSGVESDLSGARTPLPENAEVTEGGSANAYREGEGSMFETTGEF